MGVRIYCRDSIQFSDVSLTRDEMKEKIQNAPNQFISIIHCYKVYDIYIPNIIYFKEYNSEE